VDGQRVASVPGKTGRLANLRDSGSICRGHDDDTFFPGEVAEIIVHARALGAAELSELDQYLSRKYF
jgi:hypothetical protein